MVRMCWVQELAPLRRGDRIRTCDLVVPNDARYQTAPHPASAILRSFSHEMIPWRLPLHI
jgi:hypothetical protein